jgi:hypothetical protein
MLTEKFARTGHGRVPDRRGLHDTDGDAFYSVGEAAAGLSFAVGPLNRPERGGGGIPDWPCPRGRHGGSDHRDRRARRGGDVDLSGGNVKLDLVDRTWVLASGDMTLVSGIADARLLGVATWR